MVTGGIGVPFVATSTAILGSVEAPPIFEDLVNAGAPRGQAAMMASVSGTLIRLLESAGRIPFLKQISPKLMVQFKREVTSKLTNRAYLETVKRFGKTFTIVQFSEVITEMAQEIVSNTAVSFFDENRDILANVPDIAVKTAVATAPLALIGGAGASRMVTPGEQSGLSAAAKKARGWLQDNKGNWYEALRGEEGAFVPEAEPGQPEAGLQAGMFEKDKVVRPPGKGKVVKISMEAQQKLDQASMPNE